MTIKCLITGGLGFIGSNLAECLTMEGQEVYIMDDRSLGVESNLSAYLRNNFIYGDVCSPRDFAKFPDDIDFVYHFAAASSAPMFEPDPNPAYTASLFGTNNVFTYAKQIGAKVIYASSSSVYNGITPPHKEDAVISPKTHYECSKMIMENLAGMYDTFHGTKSVGLRLFSVYGKHEDHKMHYANLITQFLWALREDRPITIYGDGEQQRDFIHVNDVCRACFLSQQYLNGSGKSDVFNVGTGTATSVNEMLNILSAEYGAIPTIEHIVNPVKNYVNCVQANPFKSQLQLGFKSEVSLAEGIRKLIKHYK